MEAYLSKALIRAGAKLGVGLAVVGAVIGVRIVTVKPAGLEGDLAELERLEVSLATGDMPGAESAGASDATANGSGSASAEEPPPAAPSLADTNDLDRMVRCDLGGGALFMRAADCATRGGRLEELPPPEPEEGL
jgi:hypothetical protein